MAGVACFWLEDTGRHAISLRRYTPSRRGEACPAMPGEFSYHQAAVRIEERVMPRDEKGYTHAIEADEFEGDERWPAACGCGYTFTDEDTFQVFQESVYRRAGTGEENPVHEFGPGAMWDAWWMPWKGQDGRSINVILPNGGEWCIDSTASNCTRKGEDHDCWCRHGEPPNLTVDKNPEPGRSTCDAGGGSIWSRQGQPNDWHGFLTAGELVN